MRMVVVPVLTLISCCLVTRASAQVFGNDSHLVTIQVSPITIVQVVGNVNLSMTGASVTAGEDMMTITDRSTSLRWGINSSRRKVTVATKLVAQKFTLKLQAINPTQGPAAPEATLCTAAKDLLLNIGRSTGTCTLQYTGDALASQGAGSDVHVITFTVQSQ